MTDREEITRAAYPRFVALPTRWTDNDVYGHVNNALYYAFFDTAINEYLIAEGGLEIAAGRVIGVAAAFMGDSDALREKRPPPPAIFLGAETVLPSARPPRTAGAPTVSLV